MALSVVSATTAKAHTTGTSVDLTLNATPTTGNLLVGGMTQYINTATATITDNQSGNTYTQLSTQWSQNGTDSNNKCRMFYAKNINASGSYVIHFTSLPSGPSFAGFVYEVAGADPTIPFITGEVNTGSGTSSGAGAVTGGAVTNSVADSIIFSVICSAGAGGATITAGTNYTLDTTNGRETDGNNYETGGLEYRVVSASASQAPPWVIDNSTLHANMTAAFQIAAAVGVVARINTLLTLGVG